MEQNSQPSEAGKESLWYLDNYILLRDYYDRTISRIAARCVRMGNIAMEDYKYYGYILDVLEEISDVGDYILAHKELYPYVEKKIAGGMQNFKTNLAEYKQELKNNSSPDMIKEDALEVEKMKEVLGEFDKSTDPTVGAGMNMEQLMEKLMTQDKNIKDAADKQAASETTQSSHKELKKIIKIRKPVTPETPQTVPSKQEVK